jgi:Tol biopolymer transport system component
VLERLGVFAVLLILTLPGLFAQSVELVSRVDPSQISDTAMGTSSAWSGRAFPGASSISDDGRYQVFVSTAPNLVSGQQEGADATRDVFLRDLLTGTTVLVSHSLSSPLRPANDESTQAVISGDGRYVAFLSKATDLVPGQSPFLNTGEDVFLYDRVTQTTALVASHLFASFGSLAMSFDGRYIAFASNAGDLIPGQQGFPPGFDIFLYDRTERLFRLVSHASASVLTPGSGVSRSPLISADGRYVAFLSTSSDLVAGQPPGENLYLYDRDSGQVTAIGPAVEAVMSADGRYIAAKSLQSVYLYSTSLQSSQLLALPTPGDPYAPPSLAISGDGRVMALVSEARRLTPIQPGGGSQGLYLYDQVSRSFTLASRKHGSPTVPGTGATAPALSADGRFAAFLSVDPDLVTGQADTNRSWDVFLFDRSSGKTSLVSHSQSSDTTAGNAPSSAPDVSANGARVVFDSPASDLASGVLDRNGASDVFAFDTASGSTDAVSRRAPEMPSLSTSSDSQAQALSADGRWVAFESETPYLVAGQADSNGTTDVFLYDRATRSTILVSRSASSPARTPQGRSVRPAISADGRYVVFASNATDLVPGTSSTGDYGFFLFDRVAGTVVSVSPRRTPGSDSYNSLQARISADGRWVAFTAGNVYLWDRTTGGTTLVSHAAAGATVAGDQGAFLPLLSNDGRYVAFASSSTNLAAGQIDDADGEPDLFLYDRTTGRTVLVSHAQSSAVTATSIDPFDPTFSMSGDGRFIAFASRGENNGFSYLYLYDRTLGTNQRIASGGLPVISGDGRYVAFLSSDLEPTGVTTQDKVQVYLYDRITKAISLVTRSIVPNQEANDDSNSPAISADGRYVAFESKATDLVPGQPLPNPDPFARHENRINVFLFDRITGTMTLLSHPLSPTPLGSSYSPLLSASGLQIAFTSSSQLVPEDLNAHADAYAFGPIPTPPPAPTPLPACTLLDTRRRVNRPVLTSNLQRTVAVRGACGVPATARQVVVKVTVFNPSGKGNLRFYPGAVTEAPSGILRFERGATRAESFTLPLGPNGTLTILPFVSGKGTVHAALEVNGYFQ